jgi:sigma-B regulation protein RsbU (phosphoserine phosphatase)
MAKRHNAYNTTDPNILLNLKRQEADTLRDVLRSLNRSALSSEHIFKIARNALLAQCNVKKMTFIYKVEEQFHVGIRQQMPKITLEALQELPKSLEIRKITADSFPNLHGMGAEYVIPITYKHEVGAWFLVADFAETEAELENDLIYIETIGIVVATAIENRALITELVQQESIRRELEVAEKIQRQLLTTDFKAIKQAEIHAENVAHHHIGGDFYDVISRGEKGFFICIADVAGKGVGAALLMASIQASVRALILSEDNLKSLVFKLHKSIHGITLGEQFVTFFIAHVRVHDGQIDYINAGHNAPLLLRKGGIRELNTGTIPLGIMDLPYCEEGNLSYHPGDLLFLYTDGLVEQSDVSGNMLGIDAVTEHLRSVEDAPPREILASMNTFYRTWQGEAEQEDDITLMAVRL